MSECKYSYNFNDEIAALENSKNSLDTTLIKLKKIPWLAASEKFYAEHVAISRLLETYQLLLQKEIEDLRNVMIGVTETDEKLADSIERINNSY